MKNMKKFLSAGLATAMVASISVVPAFAATQYTPVAGTSCNFNKYLIMDKGDNVPNVTFSFTVAPGAAVSADTSDNQVFQVLPGIGTPTIADVTFAPTDSTATTAGQNIDVARAASVRATGLTALTGVELEDGEKYATKQATVSFSGITFPEPGIYRYIVTETASAADEARGIMHDNDVDRVLDVYVTDDGTGTLVVASYVLHTDINDTETPAINASMGTADVQSAAAALADKTDGFTNEYNTKDLKITKQVTGNQASRDKYFKLTATLSASAGATISDTDVFTVSIADDSDAATNDGSADASPTATAATKYSSMSNPTSVTGAQLKAGVDFYLQHGQYVVIRGIQPNAIYTVVEDAEDYASSVLTGATNTGTVSTVAGSNKVIESGFLNTRNGIIPTGIMVAVGGGAALAGAGALGVVASKKT